MTSDAQRRDARAAKERLSFARTLRAASAIIAAFFVLGDALQSTLVHFSDFPAPLSVIGWYLLRRLIAGIAGLVALMLVFAIPRLVFLRGPSAILRNIGLGVVGSSVWILLEYALGVLIVAPPTAPVIEFLLGVFADALAVTFAGMLSTTGRRLREERVRSVSHEARATAALAAMQSEELRVRRDVAEGLHGSVQQRLVLVGARIDQVVRQITEGGSRNGAVADLFALRGDLDQLRQVDVREMSQMLYPDGLEVGLVQAVRIMVRRVPSTILVDLSIAPAVNEIDTYARVMTEPQRLNLIRIIEEGVSNALRHGHASKLRVALGYADGAVTIEVEDDGTGLPAEPHLNGLGLLGHRLDMLGGHLELRQGETLGGALLTAELPLDAAKTDQSEG